MTQDDDATIRQSQRFGQTRTGDAVEYSAKPVTPIGQVVARPSIQPLEQVVRHIHENKENRPDSIEIGTPGKGGVVKLYCDFLDKADTEQRIRNAMAMRELANRLYSGETKGAD